MRTETTTNPTTPTLTIDRVLYNVLMVTTPESSRAAGHLNSARQMEASRIAEQFYLQRPKGQKMFTAVRGTDGRLSSATRI